MTRLRQNHYDFEIPLNTKTKTAQLASKSSQRTHKVTKHKCSPISSFQQFRNLIDWKTFNQLILHYKHRKHINAETTTQLFQQVYSPHSHLDADMNRIYLDVEKSESTGPHGIVRFARKLQSTFEQKPQVKAYYTRTFFHYVAFYKKPYKPHEIQFIMRFLFVAQSLTSINYSNSLNPNQKQVSFSLYDASDNESFWYRDPDDQMNYCDLPSVREYKFQFDNLNEDKN